MSSIEQAVEAAGFRTFADALRESAYGEVLNSGAPYTVFAPTDAAFGKFSSASLDRLMHGDKALLRAVVGYHFASGKVMSSQLKGKRIRAVMYAGGDLIIDGRGGMRVNTAKMTKPDMVAGACVIHGIDSVLWPKEPAAVAS
jgi:uncharacterized surface protein with fasciclin (FAS1) repeats